MPNTQIYRVWAVHIFTLWMFKSTHNSLPSPWLSISQKELSCSAHHWFICLFLNLRCTDSHCVLFGICPLLLIIMNSKTHPHSPILFFHGILSTAAVGYQQLCGSLAHPGHWAFGFVLSRSRHVCPRSCGCCTSSFLVGKYSKIHDDLELLGGRPVL